MSICLLGALNKLSQSQVGFLCRGVRHFSKKKNNAKMDGQKTETLSQSIE